MVSIEEVKILLDAEGIKYREGPNSWEAPQLFFDHGVVLAYTPKKRFGEKTHWWLGTSRTFEERRKLPYKNISQRATPEELVKEVQKYLKRAEEYVRTGEAARIQAQKDRELRFLREETVKRSVDQYLSTWERDSAGKFLLLGEKMPEREAKEIFKILAQFKFDEERKSRE